jgi:hypothetical protein
VPHQSLGGRPPADRFALAATRLAAIDAAATDAAEHARPEPTTTRARRPAGVSRWVDQAGMISTFGAGGVVHSTAGVSLVRAVTTFPVAAGGVVLTALPEQGPVCRTAATGRAGLSGVLRPDRRAQGRHRVLS